MSEEKFMTFKDYLKVIKKLSKITDELEDMDNETGGRWSRSEEESPIAGNQPRSIQKIPVMPRFAKKPYFFAFPHNSLKILMKLFDFLWGFLYNAKCNHQ